jgi:ubiquinone/menaquinone biosynthesis C-methylase UbiE
MALNTLDEQHEQANLGRVMSAYDEAVQKWDGPKARRRQWYFVFSKMCSDHRLLSELDISDKHVLNVGFAEPIDELIFAERARKWTALDLHAETVEKASQWLRTKLSPAVMDKLELVQGDATQMAFPDNTFDVVVSFSVIDHIPTKEGREKSIAEMSRVCKPGGYVIITVPNRWNLAYTLWSQWQQFRNKAFFGYEYQFTPPQLRQLMTRYGLKPLKFYSNFMFTPAIWLKPLLPIDWVLRYFGYRCGYLMQKKPLHS